jgi:hypothetical protein
MAFLPRVDHLVYAATDLDRGVAEIEALLGVRAAPGGPHPGGGTRNALIALGELTYLEIIAPDPDQPAPDGPRVFGVDELRGPRLSAWAMRAADLARLRENAVREGTPLGTVRDGSRVRPDGVRLAWRFTDPRVRIADGLVPFFIDWGTSPHPAASAPHAGTLVSLRAEHPEPAPVRRMLESLGIEMAVERGAAAALIATIDTPRGRVELR